MNHIDLRKHHLAGRKTYREPEPEQQAVVEPEKHVHKFERKEMSGIIYEVQFTMDYRALGTADLLYSIQNMECFKKLLYNIISEKINEDERILAIGDIWGRKGEAEISVRCLIGKNTNKLSSTYFNV